MTEILVDADACPVKAEIYKVARRHGLRVKVVSNSWLQTPLDDRIELVRVEGGLDVADDWIAEQARPGDVVITADIPLASRCLEKKARVLSPNGRTFTEDSIGDDLATRDLLSELREGGIKTGGPPPFGKKHRSRFLQELEEAIRRATRGF